MDLFKNKNFWAINCINQDLNSATNVKLAVIAEVTQGSKPVLGAKVCHQTWFNLVPNQSSKWCTIMKVGLSLPHHSKVVAEVERPQGAPISLILKVEPCRWQIQTIFSLLAISLILQIWHIWFWKQYLILKWYLLVMVFHYYFWKKKYQTISRMMEAVLIRSRMMESTLAILQSWWQSSNSFKTGTNLREKSSMFFYIEAFYHFILYCIWSDTKGLVNLVYDVRFSPF